MHRRQKVDGALVELEPWHFPEFVAPVNPVETVLHSIAYWIQTAREAGNPAEAVFEQGEALWWKEGNIIVPYHTDETFAQVASRMVGPPPNEALSEALYDQLSESHLRELQEFSAYLRELNPEYTGSGTMSIPLPGWTIEAGDYIFNTRTMFRQLDRISPSQWWEELTQAEQRIEMALTATANAGEDRANFENINTLGGVLNWIEQNATLIEKHAVAASIPEKLLKAILAAEFMYDYGTKSLLQDTLAGEFNVVIERSGYWGSTGISNVHYATLIEAYHYIDSMRPNGDHPWRSDPNAPDLSDFPDTTATEQEAADFAKRFYEEQNRWPKEGFEGLKLHQQNTMRFYASEANYDRLTFDEKYAVARYLVTDEGAINAASIVVAMYLDEYISQEREGATDIRAIAENLSHEDVARIFGRYRSTFEPFTYEEYGPNAHLAMPIAEYYWDQD